MPRPYVLAAERVVAVWDGSAYDYSKYCDVHQWASIPSAHRREADLEHCPACERLGDAVARKRYTDLQQRMTQPLPADHGACPHCGDIGRLSLTCDDCGTALYR